MCTPRPSNCYSFPQNWSHNPAYQRLPPRVTLFGRGAGIAQVSAAAGLSVTLVDASAAACANGLGMIKKSLDRQYKKEAEVDADVRVLVGACRVCGVL
jgi:hypothetical protein